MSDYIDRQKAIDAIRSTHDSEYTEAYTAALNMAEHIVMKLPSVDVKPVRHGHWHITDAYPHNVYCSECHAKCAQTHWAVWEDGSLPRNFCPNCGARMDGEHDG